MAVPPSHQTDGPGYRSTDARHPTELAARAARIMPRGRLAPVGVSPDLRTAADLAEAVAPAVRQFLDSVPQMR
ncbi:hypothetical protein [Streptomyces milbemycinicus]|uniref:hypothetical protein n=1 Tax=Streptomyces milbemycinicus TaxID=476552 RepID=UPI0033F31D36